jgi:hypothetical protein
MALEPKIHRFSKATLFMGKTLELIKTAKFSRKFESTALE